MKLVYISEAVMGSNDYTPPSDPQKLMADFYTIDLLKMGTKHQPSDRTEMVDYEVRTAEKTLLDHMKQHMLQMVGYSIASELRHLFDAAIIDYWPTIGEAVGRNNHVEEHDDDTCEICGGDINDCFCCKECGQPDCVCRFRDRNAKYLENRDEKIAWLSNFMDTETADAFDEAAASNRPVDFNFAIEHIREIIEAASYAFDSEFVTWKNSYGGDPWATAVTLWKKLNAASGEQIRMVVDRIYQQQHNTGSLLNKNDAYTGGGWLDMMLNLKFVANDPEHLIPMASGYIRKLAGYVLHNRYGRGFDVDSVGGPASSVKQHMIKKFLTMAKSNGFRVVNAKEGNATISHADSGELFDVNAFFFSRKSSRKPVNYYNVVSWNGRQVLSNSDDPEHALHAILLYLGV